MGRPLQVSFYSTAEISLTANLVLPSWLAAAKKNKAKPDPSGLELFDFVSNFDRLVAIAFQAIREGNYCPFPGFPAVLFVDKPRPYLRLAWIDRFLLAHLGRLYAQLAEPHFSDSLYSFRKGRGQHQAARRVAEFLRREGEVRIFRTDIASFGDEMQHERCMKDFREVAQPSPELFHFFSTITKFPYSSSQGVRFLERGLPMGAHVQLVAENLYFRKLDSALENLPHAVYSRFGDDIFFACRKQSVFEFAEESIRSEVEAAGLRLQEAKTGRNKVVRPHKVGLHGDLAFISAFSFLGRTLTWDGKERVSVKHLRATRKLIESRLSNGNRRLPLELSEVERVQALCRMTRTIIGQLEHSAPGKISQILFQIKDEQQRKEFDRWLAELVLFLALKRGWKKGNFRKYPPRILRSFGLPSLSDLRRKHARG